MAKQTPLGKLRAQQRRLVEALDWYKYSVERRVTAPDARKSLLKDVASISNDIEQLRRFLVDLPDPPVDTRLDDVYRLTLPTLRHLLLSISEEIEGLPDIPGEVRKD